MDSMPDLRAGSQDPSALKRLIHSLAKLPGIGEKTAARLAFFILRQPDEYAHELSSALLDLKSKMRICSVCCNLTEEDPCRLCSDDERADDIICVVEEPREVLALEKSREYRGRYHILHGVLSPIDGVGPEDLKIRELLERLRDSQVQEVIVATNPTVNGEATALYLSKLIRPLSIRVTRIAHGVPVGGSLEYIDEVTLSKALENRREI
jgi:recombination protein RecR